jgi:hypothetical protein
VAVAVWRLIQPGRIVLVDRDLLALRFSRLNLALNRCPDEGVALFHQSGMELANEGEADLFVIRLREESRSVNNMIVKQASEKLGKNGIILVSASSTAATRLVDDFEGILSVRSRERWRGNSLLILVK